MSKIVRGLAALTMPVSAMFVGTAEAHHPAASTLTGCGQVVVANLTLTHDVGPCSGEGLIVNSTNSITINLDGFSILGDHDSADVGSPDDAGILITGSSGVVVTNSSTSSSSIRGFDAGVVIDGGSGNTVENLTISNNIGLGGDYGEGVQIKNSSSNTIKGNVMIGNGPYAGVTLLENADSNNIGVSGAGNVIRASVAANQDMGVRLEAGVAAGTCPDSNDVSYNTIQGSSVDGITILNGGGCDSASNVLSYNTITGSLRDGIRMNSRLIGATVYGATLTNVHHNTVCGNGGAGIRATFTAESNTIADNTVGSPAPCAPNNPVVVATPSTSPLAPPHGDLHDNNLNCGSNSWTGNSHLTEFARAGSTTTPGATPPDYTCLN